MGKDLIIGSGGLLDLEGSLEAHLGGLGVKHDLKTWLAAEHDEIAICCLNSASVGEFLRHVIHCEGYLDEGTGFEAGESGTSKYRNMPWWEHSVWLPIELDHPGNLKHDIVFVGSCVALLRELRDLQNVSSFQLGVAPEGYQNMRADIRKFYQSIDDLQLTEVDYVRWIWLALRDGAELAIKHNSILCAEPG
jgi:hypothetical protein